MYNQKEQETALIQALEEWYKTEPILKPLFKLLKDAVFIPEGEFNMFLDDEGQSDCHVPSHPLHWGGEKSLYSPEEYDVTLEEFEDVLYINKQNLLARLIARVHKHLAQKAGLEELSIVG